MDKVPAQNALFFHGTEDTEDCILADLMVLNCKLNLRCQRKDVLESN